MNHRLRKVKSTIIYNESKIENIFKIYLKKSEPNFNKKDLDFKSCKKVLRELSILFCLDLESCYKLIVKKCNKKKYISFQDFKECLLNFVTKKESNLNTDFIKEQKNQFDFEYDFVPTNDDMVNNKENILNCIQSTNDINLILIHRSLYIIQKKFELNQKKIKSIYEKYGEYLENEEILLIDQNYLPIILKEIFNINKFEISDVASFKEALYKEMEYCKEINTEQYIFNEFFEFIRFNRKKYNYIYREKRHNTNFNLDNYNNLDYKLHDDWAKEGQIGLFEDEYEKIEIEAFLKNIADRKIQSAKYQNKINELNRKSKDNLKINLDLINTNKEALNNEEDKENENNSYSENNINISESRELSSKEKEHGMNYREESRKKTYKSNISNINKKEKEEEIDKDSVIPENDDEEEKEKDSNNKSDYQEDSNEDENEENEENDENSKKEENGEEKEEEEKEKEESNNENDDNKNNLEDEDLVNIDNDVEKEKIDGKKIGKGLLFSNPNKKDNNYIEKKFYETNYEKEPKNIKEIKYVKYYIYADIIPLIIADFISDQRNLYVIIDHSDDLRTNLSSIFDSEILYKLGEENLDEVINQMLIKISEYKKSYSKLEKNIDNYENLSKKMKNKNEDITYISITLQKLKEFSNWLTTKIHFMENDVIKFKEFEKNKNEEQEKIYGINFNKNAKEKLKEKKIKIIEDYKQLKRDLEIRKFMIQKRKSIINNKSKNKIKLKPIINSTILNNSNSNNNISNIEKDNSNSPNLSINSNEISGDEYKNTFVFSEQNLSGRKEPKVKNFNYKTNFDNILTEKKIESDDENESGENEEGKDIIEKVDENDFSDKDINNDELIDSNKNNNIIKENSKEKDEIEKSMNNENNENKNEDNDENNENIENKLEESKDIKEENENISEQKLKNETSKPQEEINPNKSKQIKKTKKVKLKLKSDNKNLNKIVNNENNNINKEPQKPMITITNDINNKNSNIISSDQLKSNPKTTKNTKRKVHYILKKISKPEKAKSKDEIREDAIQDIFKFYSSIKSSISTSFESIKNSQGNLTLNGFSKFCSDFKIPLTKDKILSLFNKSKSNDSRIMTLQEFKICLISLSFEINKSQIDEINRSINIFIGRVNQKNKEKSRFEKEDKKVKEKEKNKEIINKKLKLIEEYQNKTEEELIEELFKFMEIDDSNKYKQKMKGINNIENKSINLPKIKNTEKILINNTKDEYSKSHALLTFNKKEKGKSDITKKVNIGMRVWVKGMIEKERNETPKKNEIKYEYESEKSEEKEEKEEEKKENLPVIESKGIPLFSRNKKKDEKKYLYEKFL